VACRPLPTPAPPPLLRYPTLPAPDGPLITARSLRSSSLLSHGIALRARCDTTCNLTASATLTQVGLPPKRKGVPRRAVSIELPAITVRLTAGGSKALLLKPTRADIRKLGRALGKSRRVVAAIALTATGDAGEPTSQSLEITGTR